MVRCEQVTALNSACGALRASVPLNSRNTGLCLATPTRSAREIVRRSSAVAWLSGHDLYSDGPASVVARPRPRAVGVSLSASGTALSTIVQPGCRTAARSAARDASEIADVASMSV